MTNEDKKTLTKYLGEPWFVHGINPNPPNRTFSTWQDLGDLKEKMVDDLEFSGAGNFLDFTDTEYCKLYEYDSENFIDWFLNPARFCQLVADWRKEVA